MGFVRSENGLDRGEKESTLEDRRRLRGMWKSPKGRCRADSRGSANGLVPKNPGKHHVRAGYRVMDSEVGVSKRFMRLEGPGNS